MSYTGYHQQQPGRILDGSKLVVAACSSTAMYRVGMCYGACLQDCSSPLQTTLEMVWLLLGNLLCAAHAVHAGLHCPADPQMASTRQYDTARYHQLLSSLVQAALTRRLVIKHAISSLLPSAGWV